MIAFLAGMGWVTPLGRGLEQVQAALAAGDIPEIQWERHPATNKEYPVFRAPPGSLADVAAFARLRRSSPISHFAVAAAVDAAAALSPEQRTRTALVFAASDGGVVYTRRFYGDVVERGPGAGSPLLFPETVYNAPASHIAARLGLEGESLTLVGDVEVGFDAVRTACELLACGDADHCLVAAAQEIDWITCDAYSRWRLAGENGAVFSEGAGALLLSREGPGCRVQTVENLASLPTFSARLDAPPDVIVSSDSGTSMGRQESASLHRLFPNGAIQRPKKSLGEAMACSSIQQVIHAALTLKNSGKSTALACATGFNCGISALFLTANNSRA
jgi:3-oxoacyl-(acyl-carrier-protein) synthase